MCYQNGILNCHCCIIAGSCRIVHSGLWRQRTVASFHVIHIGLP
jgi:hypothetical protein